MNETIWSDLHKSYSSQDWIDKPSLFAETALSYFPTSGKLLELGAGQGQDSRFFAEHGYEVTSTDFEASALAASAAKLPGSLKHKITIQKVDLREELPFMANSFDIVYAHLSLHYFDAATTRRIFEQISRVLKAGGMLAFFVNSVDDPEYGTGSQIEPNYFQIDQTAKRYFSVASTRTFISDFFETKLLDNQGETYKDADKGVHNLIRFIGNKLEE